MCLGAVWAGGAAAQTTSATRTSSFAYDAASGLLTQEVVEPNTPALRLEIDYVYDAFGNKTSITVSGVDIATRTSTATFDARGQFATTNANALNQSESFQYDARFAQATSHTGPNGLTTSWTYGSFGRKTSELRPDGTQTKWSYQFCSGVNGGTASCVSGAAYLIQATPLAADSVTQIGPTNSAAFSSRAGRTSCLAARRSGRPMPMMRSVASSPRRSQTAAPARPPTTASSRPPPTASTRPARPATPA